MRKLGLEVMKPLLARCQSAPRTVHVEVVPNSLASFVGCDARFLKDPSDRQNGVSQSQRHHNILPPRPIFLDGRIHSLQNFLQLLEPGAQVAKTLL
jgi:hypothetical protein